MARKYSSRVRPRYNYHLALVTNERTWAERDLTATAKEARKVAMRMLERVVAESDDPDDQTDQIRMLVSRPGMPTQVLAYEPVEPLGFKEDDFSIIRGGRPLSSAEIDVIEESDYPIGCFTARKVAILREGDPQAIAREFESISDVTSFVRDKNVPFER